MDIRIQKIIYSKTTVFEENSLINSLLFLLLLCNVTDPIVIKYEII